MSGTLKFKRKFKPQRVEIDGKDDSTFVFKTVSLTRTAERKFAEAQQEANRGLLEMTEENEDISAEQAQDAVVKLILDAVDMLVVPAEGKKTPASKVLRGVWDADEIELGDLLDFLNDLATKRRPT